MMPEGFENGQPVPTVGFDYPDDEAGDIAHDPSIAVSTTIALFAYVVEVRNPEQVWRRAELLAFMFRAHGAAQSQRELADRVGVSGAAVSKAVKLLKRKLPKIIGEFTAE